MCPFFTSCEECKIVFLVQNGNIDLVYITNNRFLSYKRSSSHSFLGLSTLYLISFSIIALLDCPRSVLEDMTGFRVFRTNNSSADHELFVCGVEVRLVNRIAISRSKLVAQGHYLANGYPNLLTYLMYTASSVPSF